MEKDPQKRGDESGIRWRTKALLGAGAATGVVGGGYEIYANGDGPAALTFLTGSFVGGGVDHLFESAEDLPLLRGTMIFLWAAATALTSYASVRSGLTPDFATGFGGAFAGSLQQPGRETLAAVGRVSHKAHTVYRNTKESVKKRRSGQ